MSPRLNDIFGMAVHFAAIFMIIAGFLEAIKEKHRFSGIALIILGFLILIFFRTIIGDNIVPVG